MDFILLTAGGTAARADATDREQAFCAGLGFAPGRGDRRPIDHCELAIFGTAIGTLIDNLVSPAKKCGFDRADHHEAFGVAIRAMQVGRKRIADLVKMA
jgi:hypothetical protein